MKTRLNIALRYCGGCNPHYDRAAAVERIKGKLADVAEFNAYRPGETYDFVLVVQGCSRECVLHRADNAPGGIIFVNSESDAAEAVTKIKGALEKK